MISAYLCTGVFLRAALPGFLGASGFWAGSFDSGLRASNGWPTTDRSSI